MVMWALVGEFVVTSVVVVVDVEVEGVFVGVLDKVFVAVFAIPVVSVAFADKLVVIVLVEVLLVVVWVVVVEATVTIVVFIASTLLSTVASEADFLAEEQIFGAMSML